MRLERNRWMRKKTKKNWNEKKTKKREEGLVGIFFFFNYNYSSSQQIKNKIYHNIAVV